MFPFLALALTATGAFGLPVSPPADGQNGSSILFELIHNQTQSTTNSTLNRRGDANLALEHDIRYVLTTTMGLPGNEPTEVKLWVDTGSPTTWTPVSIAIAAFNAR
jgi:hypothetical protein